MRFRALLSLLFAVPLVTAFAIAPNNPAFALHGTETLEGTVTDATTGVKLDNVCVTIGVPITCFTYSNADGFYRINLGDFAPSGFKADFYFLRAGYVTKFHTEKVSQTGPTILDVQLSSKTPGSAPPPTTPPTSFQTPPPASLLPVATPAPVAVVPAPTVNVEQRIADFWRRIDALAPTDNVSAGDLGGWALNVIERSPRARLTAADFRASTAEMQAGLDRAGLGPVPAVTPTPVANIEQRIADFWTRIGALQPGDHVSAADLGQWALNVIGRIPRAQLSAADFRASTAGMQGGFDRAGLAPAP